MYLMFLQYAGMSRVLKLSSSVVDAFALRGHVRNAKVEFKCT